jgi:hypothetical protein
MAQESDLGFRGQMGLQYRFNKKSNISFSYRLDLKENISQFRRSNFNLVYERSLNKWLEAELYYRFITNYKQDEHRFRASLSAKKKIFRRTRLKFRTLVQHDIEYFDGDYLSRYKPTYVWRNRLLLQRKLDKRVNAIVYTEPFVKFRAKGNELYRWRTGAMLSYEKKKWKYSAEYFIQQELDENSYLHILGISARYDITRLIRPKKKKK